MNRRFERLLADPIRLQILATIIAALLVLLLAVVYRSDLTFVLIAVPVGVSLVTIAAFNAYHASLLLRTIDKLDELLRVFEKTKGDLSTKECQTLHNDLLRIRATLLRQQSLTSRTPGD